MCQRRQTPLWPYAILVKAVNIALLTNKERRIIPSTLAMRVRPEVILPVIFPAVILPRVWKISSLVRPVKREVTPPVRRINPVRNVRRGNTLPEREIHLVKPFRKTRRQPRIKVRTALLAIPVSIKTEMNARPAQRDARNVRIPRIIPAPLARRDTFLINPNVLQNRNIVKRPLSLPVRATAVGRARKFAKPMFRHRRHARLAKVATLCVTENVSRTRLNPTDVPKGWSGILPKAFTVKENVPKERNWIRPPKPANKEG